MSTLFVLVPADRALDAVLGELPNDVRTSLATLRCRRYPRADGPAHAASLVRAGRDPGATRWLSGLVSAVLLGAVLGGIVNGILASAFGFLGGLLEIAIPLGVGVGAFLGGFTAAMTGTEVARAELRPLLAKARAGEQLVQWSHADTDALRQLAAHCEQLGLAAVLVTD